MTTSRLVNFPLRMLIWSTDELHLQYVLPAHHQRKKTRRTLIRGRAYCQDVKRMGSKDAPSEEKLDESIVQPEDFNSTMAHDLFFSRSQRPDDR
jgi:hypothetical protein